MTGFPDNSLVLGIDVGSVSISVVALKPDGRLMDHDYRLHHGEIPSILDEMLQAYHGKQVLGVAVPSGKIRFNSEVHVYDIQVALMQAASQLDTKARSILHVGAERFFLIRMDDEGTYEQTSHNSSCAAGTGSFLDQQAIRLQLKDTASLSAMAMRNQDPVPGIAARCSVFAKTDLIHAQQKGYSLEAICDSLCMGLAENIADTLFNRSLPQSPMIMTGGVSRNKSVHAYLEKLAESKIFTHEHSHCFPALGAALLFLEKYPRNHSSVPVLKASSLLGKEEDRSYFYRPLEKEIEAGSTGHILDSYLMDPQESGHPTRVEVELYIERIEGDFYLGIDVGSTSTKAVLLNGSGEAVAGFYTYTSGQPLKAVQAIFEAIWDLNRKGARFEIIACATTGSGRKFIGGIVGADQDVDEITAHARAAYEIDPSTDTIIEIGGQDAKFTQMKDGVVVFSHMNTVCAAGTGSFIEELAGRLGVQLEDYERLALGKAAPLASDRCTVFMERDINQLLSQGYPVEEVLATVIHSVRENYLKKVASESLIGDHICFQGATARNRALVAAFEQRLEKAVHVSPLCHLTGALGAAMLLREEHQGKTSFRGLDLYRESIPIETETCELCLNKCTISLAMIRGEKQAYGFLCGRDYDTKKHVSTEGKAFSFMEERKKLFRETGKGKRTYMLDSPVIGLPHTLQMVEDHGFWLSFFEHLGLKVLSSRKYRGALKSGKKKSGAEFCAPMVSIYGHLSWLESRCDHIFMPVSLESREKQKDKEENLCYYTQYSGSLAFQESPGIRKKLIAPLLNFHRGTEQLARGLLKEFRTAGLKSFTQLQISEALRAAKDKGDWQKEIIQQQFASSFKSGGDVSVVLLGRPYVVLSESLNKGIPGIFSKMEVDAYYQDMLEVDPGKDEALNRLLEKVPWHFAADILRAAENICRKPGLYPVLITAFKCAPDSFILEYFKQLMRLYNKPYLIIQIDEHDSNVGYETRIEAAIRSFRNHAVRADSYPDRDLGTLLPRVDTSLNGKTLLLPNWDGLTGRLLAANLQRAGVDARLLEPDELSMRKSMVHNTGQCLPINMIAQDYIDYIIKYKLDPARTILWMMEGKVSCNLRQYPYYIKSILENYGRGMEHASVYSGELTHREMSLSVTYYAYFAYMLGGLFRKLACRIRPYEELAGATDRVMAEVEEVLVEALLGKRSIESAVRRGTDLFRAIQYEKDHRKPLVAVFGDLYVRENEIMNQDLVRSIEEAGGEALITPYHEYVKIIIENIFRRANQRKEYVETGMNRIILNILKFMDDRYYKHFEPFLGPSPLIKPKVLEKHLKRFNIYPLHSGESYDNILKIFFLKENYPELALFVQTNPAFCCPALVTEAMTGRIREITGVPVVTLTYDGTASMINEAIVPYIANARSVSIPGN